MPATYQVTDMHTAGEPVRIVTAGYPPLEGDTILAKRRFVREHLDHIRRRLMLEPRGHAEMYGVIPTAPSHPDCALAVLFMHNSGYSTMCGHATIAIGRWAVEQGLVKATPPVTRFNLECPCGPVAVSVAEDMTVSFESVPAFVERRDDTLAWPATGNVAFDVAYGGAFYAILPARRLGFDLLATPLATLIDAGTRFTTAVRNARTIRHPREPDLAFLYGTILTDDAGAGAPTRNLCVFGEGQVDRSPTGSGVTARVALDVARGTMAIGATREFHGVSDVPFVGQALRQETDGVIVRVSGRAHHAGTATFVIEDDDPLSDGLALGGTASWPVRDA
jgi:trans-L-3-hydroxyproline dehydratase